MPAASGRRPWLGGATAAAAEGPIGQATLTGDMDLHCYLGHGASGTAASMTAFVDGLRARGVPAAAIDLPKRKAEDAVPGVPPGRPARTRRGRRRPLVRRPRREPGRRRAGRTLCRARLFSYPLHPPGAPERTDARTAHWPSIRCPVLLLSGESDPFAKIDLLRATVPRLADRPNS